MPIGTTNYPSSLDTQSTLVEARNNASTTLTVALPSTTNANPTLTLSVVSTASFPPTGIFRINNELFSYDSKNDTNNTFNVIARQFESSPLESHSSGDTVSLDITAASNNVKNSAIIAVETKLGVGSSTPTNGTVLKGTGSGTSGWGSITLGTDTDGNYVSNVTGSGGVTVTHTAGEGSTAAVSLNPAASPSFAGLTATGGVTANNVRVGITANNEIDTSSGNLILDSTGGTVTVDDNLTVSGNFTVNGTTTIINSNTLEIGDNLIILNADYTGSTPSENAGIEVERGDLANTSLRWNESFDKWELTSDGTNYGNIVTTADSQTVTSSMIKDDTIVNGDISNSAAISLSKLANGTSGQIPIADSSGILTYRTLSGSITINNVGTTSIANDAVTLGTHTTGNYVATITGTSNQVIVTGSGSETAAVTLSLPQSIGTSSTPTFSGITVGQVNSSSNLTLSTASGGNILLTPSGNVSITGNVNIGGTSPVLTINGSSSSIVVRNTSSGNGIIISPSSNQSISHTLTLTTDPIISPNGSCTLKFPIFPNGVTNTLISTGDTGTVTGTMVADNAISYAKMQATSNAGVFLGRSSSSSGVIQEIGRGDLDIVALSIKVRGGGTAANQIQFTNSNLYLSGSSGIVCDPTETQRIFRLSTFSTSNTNDPSGNNQNTSIIQLRRARNTEATPLAVTNGSNVGIVDFQGYDGAAYTSAGSIRVFSSSSWTTTLTSKSSQMILSYEVAGVDTEIWLYDNKVEPGVTNTQSLGSASSIWSSVFSRSCSLVNANNVTHSIAASTAGSGGPFTATLPNSSGIIVLDSTTQTLTNKTLSTNSIWNGSVISAQFGGTGVNNGSNTLTLSGGSVTLTTSGATNVTLPTTGTLATISGSETLSSKTLSSPTFSGAITTDTSNVSSAGYLGTPINSRTDGVGYTLVLSDGGKTIVRTGTAAGIIIPQNSGGAGPVAFPIGTIVTFVNSSNAAITISITTDTLTWSATGTTGSRSLATNGVATAIKVGITNWLISGVGLS